MNEIYEMQEMAGVKHLCEISITYHKSVDTLVAITTQQELDPTNPSHACFYSVHPSAFENTYHPPVLSSQKCYLRGPF